MTKRKKRLIKGIDSLQKQIELHLDKKKKAEDDENFELIEYYNKEIKAKEEDKKRKQEILDKQ